ncbi:MAG TPA: pyridoxine 5'-phosphate synthase [Saprospiraceae bacterium]|nr:pyridoxine 5'-phosphate synthase [Saprospiraceae bacterium]HNT22269.1 pyridoxine 5'-phosphate synthase [Saprospiraceae bacterium]
MTRLSVNINKIALIRNSRGGNMPDLIQVARDCERFGAEGITIHPRPDQRHIRYSDIQPLKEAVATELNIEGYPSQEFMDRVLSHRPDQVTLVPDPPGALTSDHGWDTVLHSAFLEDVVKALKSKGIRTSLFVDANPRMVEGAARSGTDRIELYTGPYAHRFPDDPEASVKPHREAALVAAECGLGLNAGHDLNLHNLKFYKDQVPGLLEVSIGHALICDALYMGLEKTIGLYLQELK